MAKKGRIGLDVGSTAVLLSFGLLLVIWGFLLLG